MHIQKRLFKHICNRNRVTFHRFNYDNLCSQYNLPSLQKRRENIDIILFKKIISGYIDCPNILSKVNLNVPARPLRNHSTFYPYVCNPKINVTMYSYIPRVQVLCNSLSDNTGLDIFHASIRQIKQLL